MNEKLIVNHFQTPAGNLEVLHDEHSIFQSRFIDLAPITNETKPSFVKPIYPISQQKSPVVEQILFELNEYFSDPHHRFQLKLSPIGTTYQKKVWNSLLVIPAGRTVTYGDLSHQLNSSPRAIGQACKKNPLTIFIPCHRVIGQTNLGGYMGSSDAMQYKKNLLTHEGYIFKNSPEV